MMQSFFIVESLQQIFQQHAIPYTMEDHWLVPYGDFNQYPAIRALWFPYETNGCLQIEVLHQDSRLMIECFAGVGKGEEAIADAFQNFCLNSFHVFAVAFWQLQADEQVEIEHWTVKGKNYLAYIGVTGHRMFGLDTLPALPEDWFDCLETIIKKDTLIEEMAWFRMFVGQNQAELTVEVLKNNEVWEEAQDHIRQLNWMTSDGYYSIRNFIILVEDSVLSGMGSRC